MMKRCIACILILFFSQGLLAQPSVALPASYATAVSTAAPAVVNVYTLRSSRHPAVSLVDERFFPQQGLPALLQQRMVLGSGVIMDKAGYILTNEHVLRNRNKVWVSLLDGRTSEAQVIGMDPETDLAVLRIHLENLPHLHIADMNEVQVGDIVLAIGNPFGLGQTVTQGIISALGRNAVGLSNIENYIQTDVALNPGSSGGALINTLGQLVGINVGIYTRSGGYQGVSFAIPVSAADSVLNQIIRYGHVKRGWLGVEVVNLTDDIAKKIRSQQSLGVVVERVLKGSPASGKLKPLDVITEINHHKLRSAQGFFSTIAQLMPGKSVNLIVFRNHKMKDVMITLGSRPTEPQLRVKPDSQPGKPSFVPDDR